MGKPIFLAADRRANKTMAAPSVDLAGIACSGAATCSESRLQFGQALLRGAGAGAFVLCDRLLCHAAILVLHFDGHGDDLLLEPAVLLSSECLLVGVFRHLILAIPRDAIGGCHVLRRQTHGQQASLCVLVVQNLCRQLCDVDGGHHREHAHVLHTTSKADIDDAALDGCCDVGGGLEAAAALAIDSAQRDVVGQLGHELAHPGGQSTGARLKHVADLDVTNVFRIHLRPFDNRPENPRQELLRGGVVEGAPLCLGQRCPDGTADHHVVIRFVCGAEACGWCRSQL